MAYGEQVLKDFKESKLGMDDTFTFECAMCGNCCRKREDPIAITGPDMYRLAKYLGTSMRDVLLKYTTGVIGADSHLPVALLKEREDGSCIFLRKGKCTVQESKPVVCALFPIGRAYSPKNKTFEYFLTQPECPATVIGEKTWTLREWLEKFHIQETEENVIAWGTLITETSLTTSKYSVDWVRETLGTVLSLAMYTNYDMQQPYAVQAYRNLETLRLILEEAKQKVPEK